MLYRPRPIPPSSRTRPPYHRLPHPYLPLGRLDLLRQRLRLFPETFYYLIHGHSLWSTSSKHTNPRLLTSPSTPLGHSWRLPPTRALSFVSSQSHQPRSSINFVAAPERQKYIPYHSTQFPLSSLSARPLIPFIFSGSLAQKVVTTVALSGHRAAQAR